MKNARHLWPKTVHSTYLLGWQMYNTNLHNIVVNTIKHVPYIVEPLIVQRIHNFRELSLLVVMKGLLLPSTSMARLELEYLSTATCEHLAYLNRTVPSSSAVSSTCAMCECLAHSVQTEFPSHYLITLLLLPVNTQLLMLSLGEKERKLSHHALRIVIDSAYV